MIKKFLLVAIVVAAIGAKLYMMQKLQEAIQRNEKSPSVEGKQALVFGGTSGIGRALAERLAKGGASVTIAGRNEAEAKKILATMSRFKKNGDQKFDFIKSDASLLQNNKDAVEKFEASATRLDFLIFCQTKATLQGRTPTADGIDEKLSLNYYSRVYITNLLAPLMTRTVKKESPIKGDPRVMTVLSAGMHKPYAHYQEDPYLADEGRYSQSLAADITSFYSDLWVDKASQLWPEITFVHVSPGFVNTQWGTDMPWYALYPIRLFQRTLAKSAEDCAESLLPGLVDPDLQGGYHLLNQFSDPAPKTALHTTEAVDRVHEDTMKLIKLK